MSEITTLKLWRDTGFTEGNTEVPKISSLSLADPDVTITEGLFPSKEAFFNQVKIEGEYLELFDMSYLEATYEFNNPKTVGQTTTDSITLYAWIDEVALQSDNEDRPITVITYHIDYWRTYAGTVTYGYGMVTRRPRGTEDPQQNVSYRYREPKGYTQLMNNHPNTRFAIVCYTYEYTRSEETYTGEAIAVIPLNKETYSAYTYFKTRNGTTRHSISMADILAGRIDEYLGLDPTAIKAVYMSPISPFGITSGTGTESDPYVLYDTDDTTRVRTRHLFTEKYIKQLTLDSVGVNYNAVYSDGTTGTIQATATPYPFGVGQPAKNWTYSLDGGSTEHTYKVMYLQKVTDFITNNGIDTTGWADGDYIELWNAATFMPISTTTINSISHPHTVVASSYTTGNKITWDGNAFDKADCYMMIGSSVSTELLDYANYDTYVTPASSTSSYNIMEPKSGSGYNVIRSNSGNYYEHSFTLDSSIMTGDTKEYFLTDFQGHAVGAFPWGVSCQTYKVRCVLCMTGGYIEIRFNDFESHMYGTSFDIPLPTLDLSSNSWSSYLYSGQRDYDIQQRDIANKQALMNNLMGGQSMVAGYIGYTGGMDQYNTWNAGDSSKVANLINNNKFLWNNMGGTGIKGAVATGASKAIMNPSLWGLAGGAAGLGISAAAAGFNYWKQGEYNKQLQSAYDTAKAKQTDSLILGGEGFDWLYHGRMPCIMYMEPDAYSALRFANSVTYNGIECSEPTASCDTMVKTGTGPLQIQNLIVTGEVPVQAKYAIADKLSAGVRLI